MSKTRPRGKPVRAAAQKPERVRPWPGLLAEIVLLALVLVIPVIINRYSRNFLDAKDAALGIGIAVGLSLWLVAGLAQGRLSWATSRLNLAVLAYVIWAGISVCYSGYYWFVSISEFGRLVANVGIFCLALVCLRTATQVRRVIAAACLAAVPVCLYAFLQASGRDFIAWKDPVVRVHSTIGNSTYLGGYCQLMIPFAAVLAWPQRAAAARRPWLLPVLVGIVIVMLTITLFLSFTLAAMIGLGLGAVPVVLLLLFRERGKGLRKAVVTLLLAVVIVAPIAYGVYRFMPARQQERVQSVLQLHDPATRERSLHWRTAYRLFQEKPVFGWGYGAFRVQSLEMMAKDWYSQRAVRTTGMLAPGYAHNEFLQAMADTGVIGTALFVAILLLAYGLAFRVSLRHPDPFWRRLGLAGAAMATGFLFQNQVGVTFHQTGTVTFFWLWLALLVVAAGHLPRGVEASQEMRLREFRFRPRPVAAAVTALAAAGAVALVAWASVRPAIANVTVREAQILAGQGHQEAAIAASQRTLELCPYSALAYYTLAFSYGNLKHYDKALQANLKSLELMPGNGSALYNLGIVYKEMGRPADAEDAFRRAVAVMPSADNRIGLAETLLNEGKLEEAEEQGRRAAELLSEFKEERLKQAQLYLLLADIASRRKDMEATLSYSRQAVSLQPTQPKIQANLIRLLMGMRRDREAVEACRSWAKADPRSGEAHHALGAAEYKLKNFPAAREALTRAVELEPSNLRARLNLAYALGKLRDLAGYRRELEVLAATGGEAPEAKLARQLLAKLQRAQPVPPAG